MVKTKGLKSISIENVNVKTDSNNVKLPSGNATADTKKDQTDNVVACAILGMISDVFYGKQLSSTDALQAASTLKTTIGSSFNSMDAIIEITTNINKNLDKIIDKSKTAIGTTKTSAVNVTNNNTLSDDVRIIKDSTMIIADAIRLNNTKRDESVLTYLDKIYGNIVKIEAKNTSSEIESHVIGNNNPQHIDVELKNTQDFKTILNSIKELGMSLVDSEKHTSNSDTITTGISNILNTVLQLSELNPKSQTRILYNLKFIQGSVLDKLLDIGKKISDVSKEYGGETDKKLVGFSVAIHSLVRALQPLAGFGFIAPLVMFGAVGLGAAIKVVNKFVIGNFDTKHAEEYKIATDTITDFGKTVALLGATLIVGSLLMTIVDTKNIAKFIAVETMFVGAMLALYAVIGSEIKTSMQGAEDFGKLVALSAAALIVGGLISMIPGFIQSAILFGLTLAAFVAGIMTIWRFASKGVSLSLTSAGEFGKLIAISAATILVGGLLFMVGGAKLIENVILFSVVLGAFVFGIMKIWAISTADTILAIEGAMQFAALITISAATLIIGGLVFMMGGDKLVKNILLFSVVLGAFVFGMSKVIGMLSSQTLNWKNVALSEIAMVGLIGILWLSAKAFDAIGYVWKNYSMGGIIATLGVMTLALSGVAVMVRGIMLLISGTGGIGGLLIAGAEAAMLGLVSIIWVTAKAMSAVAIAGKDMDENLKNVNWSTLVKNVYGFGSVATALTNLTPSLWTAYWAAQSLTYLSMAVSSAAVAMKNMVDLKIPIYEGTTQTGWLTLADEDFKKATTNTELIITSLARGVISGIDGHPEYFGRSWMSMLTGDNDAPAITAARAVCIVANAIAPLAEGLVAMSELKIPTYNADGSIKSYIGIGTDSTIFQKVSFNIENIITAAARGLVNGISNHPDLFNEGLFTNSPAENAAKTVMLVANAIKPIAEGLMAMENLKIPTFDSRGNIIGYTGLSTDTFNIVANNVEKIVTASARGLVNGVKNNTWLFGEGIFTDSPAMNAAKSINIVSGAINTIAKSIGMYAKGIFPVYEMDANGNWNPIKSTLKPVTSADMENAGKKIKQILTCVASALVSVVNDDKTGMFKSGMLSDSAALNAAEAVNKTAASITNILTTISKLSKTNVKTLNADILGMKYKTKIMIRSIVDVISTITSKDGWKTIGYTYNGNDSIADWLDNAISDVDNFSKNIETVKKSFDVLSTIITSFGGTEFQKAYNNFRGPNRSLSHLLNTTINQIIAVVSNLNSDVVQKSITQFEDSSDLITKYLMDVDSTFNLIKSIADNINETEHKLKTNTVDVVCGTIQKINNVISTLSATGQNIFKQQTNELDKYIKAINSVKVDNIDKMTGLVQGLNQLGARLGNLDNLTDAIANALSVELKKLTSQLQSAAVTIHEADKLQQRRHQLIQHSIENVKTIMAQKINVEIRQEIPQQNTTDTTSTAGSDNTASTNTNAVSLGSTSTEPAPSKTPNRGASHNTAATILGGPDGSRSRPFYIKKI